MNVYRCKLLGFDNSDSWRAKVELLDDHARFGGNKGEVCTTSRLKSIDFEKGVIQTQNSIYIIKQEGRPMTDNAVTPQQFAEWLHEVGRRREASYDPIWIDPTTGLMHGGKYMKRYDECIAEVVPEVWRPIFACLTTPDGGFSDVWDWAEKHREE